MGSAAPELSAAVVFLVAVGREERLRSLSALKKRRILGFAGRAPPKSPMTAKLKVCPADADVCNVPVAETPPLLTGYG